MEVLEVLPIDEILKKVVDSFSGWNIQGEVKILKKKDMEHFSFLRLRKS